MSQAEVLWGAFSLMLFGALVTLCMKCQRAGGKPGKTRLSAQLENQQTFEAVRSYSISRQDHVKVLHNIPGLSKSKKHLSAPRHDNGCTEPRYQNLGKEPQMDQEAAYVEPICTDYYNCRKFLRPPSDEDSHSYQNVFGPSQSSGSVLAEVEVYENSPAFEEQEYSRISENSEEDSEPDYINSEFAFKLSSSLPV